MQTKRHVEYGLKYPETTRTTGMLWWRKTVTTPEHVELQPGASMWDIKLAFDPHRLYPLPVGTEAVSRFVITADNVTLEIGPWTHAYVPTTADNPKPKPGSNAAFGVYVW